MAFSKKGKFKEITGLITREASDIKDKYIKIYRTKHFLYKNLKESIVSDQKIELPHDISELIGNLMEDVQWQIYSIKRLRIIVNRLKVLLEKETSIIPYLEKQIETTFEDIERMFRELQQVYAAQLKLLNELKEKENWVRELRATLVSELYVYKSYSNLKNRLSNEKKLLIKEIQAKSFNSLNKELLRASALLTYIIKKAPSRI